MAAAFFKIAYDAIISRGIKSLPMLKCSSERWVCAPHSLSAGTLTMPRLSLSCLMPAMAILSLRSLLIAWATARRRRCGGFWPRPRARHAPDPSELVDAHRTQSLGELQRHRQVDLLAGRRGRKEPFVIVRH